MTRGFSILLLCVIGFVAKAATPERSVSITRQFVVYGPDARFRGAVCDVAEQSKTAVLRLLGERDAWKTPIVINAHYPEANSPETPPAQLDVSQTGFGLKLQLELVIDTNASGRRAEREILRAIFLEMIYRTQPQISAGAAYVPPPDWLIDGTIALAMEQDAADIAQTLNTAVNGSGVIALEDFLQQRPALMEPTARRIYRGYSAALVTMLTDMPEGRARLARFISDLPQSGNDSLGDLRRHFPALGENADVLQKNWGLNVARVSASELYRLLSCEETERRLAEILRVELPDRHQQLTVFGLEEFPTFLREPNAVAALQKLNRQLLLLSGQAHPLYRPIITEYQEIAALLVRKKTKHLAERLAKIRGVREHVSRRMSEIDDYMNWFEATQSHSTSGRFREYLRAAELAREPEPRRHDPISIYLDALEAQLGD